MPPELALLVSVGPDGECLLMLRRGEGPRMRWVPPFHVWPAP